MKNCLYPIMLCLLISCSTNPKQRYINTNVESSYNFPLYDFFKEKGYIGLQDFDVKGNVQRIVYYKPIPEEKEKQSKKTKQNEFIFDKNGRLLEKKTFHGGSFFFNGKVKTKEIILYAKHSRQLIEDDFSKDSSITVYLNKYDKEGHLVSTENQRGGKIYTYDKKGRIIKEESYSKTQDIVSTYTYEYIDDFHKIKSRAKKNQFDIPFQEHFYYRKDGSLEERKTITGNDSTLMRYNKNRDLVYTYKARNGNPYLEETYWYADNNLLMKEKVLKRGQEVREVTYKYDHNNNLSKITTCFTNDFCSEVTYIYEYDDHQNWIKKQMIQHSSNGTNRGNVMQRTIYYD